MTEKTRNENYAEMMQEKREELMEQLDHAFNSYVEDPNKLNEFLDFSSKFYKYSLRNMMLIQMQKPNAVYVDAYQRYKKRGIHVNRGEKGIKILVPAPYEVFINKDGELRLKKNATKEEKRQIEQGLIKTESRMSYKLGNVFDLSQTNLPKEKYPEFLHPGQDSTLHDSMFNVILGWAMDELDISYDEKSLPVGTFGYIAPDTKEIVLTTGLTSEQRLSTFTHELGHAATLDWFQKKSIDNSSLIEITADAFSIFMQNRLGLTVDDSRKRHFIKETKTYMDQGADLPEKKARRTEALLASTDIFRHYNESLDKKLNPLLEKGREVEYERER